MNNFTRKPAKPRNSNRFSALFKNSESNDDHTENKKENYHKVSYRKRDPPQHQLKINNRWKFTSNYNSERGDKKDSFKYENNRFNRKRDDRDRGEVKKTYGLMISKYSRKKEEKPKEFNMEEEMFPSLGGDQVTQEAPKQAWTVNFSDVAKKADEREKQKMEEIENKKIEEIKKRQQRKHAFYRYRNINLDDEDVRKEILRAEKEEEYAYIREQRRLENRIYQEELAIYEEEMAMDYDSDEEYYKDNLNEHLGKSKRW